MILVDEHPRGFDKRQVLLLQRVGRQMERLLELHDLRMARAEAGGTPDLQSRLQDRFARVFQVSPDPMALLRLDTGTFVEINDAFLQVVACSRDQVIGRTSRDLGYNWVDRDYGASIAEAIRRDGSVRNVEVKLRLRTGRTWLGLLSAEVIEMEGRPCLLTVAKDISEIRRLEEQLLQAQKMDAIGRLAGGIAHDFNNFLTIIHGYSEVLLTQAMELPQGIRKPILEMRAAAERAAGLTRQLLAFSRQQVLRLQDVDLNRVISSNERMLRSAISEQIDLRLRLEPMLGRVQADPSQIDQIILNLVINARDAMPHGGSTEIETQNVQFSQSTPFGNGHVPAGRWIRLAVKDTGHGMNDTVQSHIFEPFFTTKEDGRGTGLGLATVYGIVKQSGGYIAVTSEPGVGTTFEILLPRFDAPVSARMEEPPSRTPLEGTETILLVEDEEAIRLLCSEVLEGQGYTVLTAENGEDALRVSGQTDGPIHLLITDVVLPRLSGDVLAATLRRQRPALAVLFMSGMPEHPRQMHPPAPGEEVQFLQKPFSPARLSRTVRDLLDRSSSGSWLQ
jgi:PAS domain S-box-containing protein